jgi:protein-tyrosine phosphatase
MPMSKHVLFLCTGNYYRSRFAEILFNHLASQKKLDWRAQSRGLKIGWPGNIGPISPYSLERLKRLGISCDSSRQMPMQCRLCDLEDATIVIALKEAEHRPMLAEYFSPWQDRVQYWHVHDLDGATPVEALAEIEVLVKNLVDELAAHPKNHSDAVNAAEHSA